MKRITFILFSIAFLLISCEKEFGPGYFSGGTYDGEFYENSEKYNDYEDNPFVDVSAEPISTFSIDADGGSYSNVRRFLNSDQLPPKGAVRIEELINYFPFNYSYTASADPLSLNGEVAECPWTTGHKIIRIGMVGQPLSNPRPASTIVFLIDISGSMRATNKLPLLKYAYKKLVDQLDDNDHVAIVTYAGHAGVALPATTGDQKSVIKAAIDDLGSGGGTAGAAGINKAYEIAQQNFKMGGNNRIILGTDGDFNVGVSNQDDLVSLIETKRDEGVFITVCGVGTGNYNEAAMEQVADHGNGTYEYIDSEEQAIKVFVSEFNKFFTVAQDVKVQVAFNPDIVEKYRLIGYENRVLNNEDFNDDTKDAGELGAGQTVTALYEIDPVDQVNWKSGSVFTIDFKYKRPGEITSQQMTLAINDEGKKFADASENLRFASSLAGYGMLLRDSPYKGNITYGSVKSWAQNALTYNPGGYRIEFLNLIDKAKNL